MNLLQQGPPHSVEQKFPAGRIISELNFLSRPLKADARTQTNNVDKHTLSAVIFFTALIPTAAAHSSRTSNTCLCVVRRGPEFGTCRSPPMCVCVCAQVTSRTKVRDELDQRICRSICLSARLGVCQPSGR
jgi:hypothetical protein